MFQQITYDSKIFSVKPYIRGTRLSVKFILELFASDATRYEVLKAYPQLTAEAVEEALEYRTRSSFKICKSCFHEVLK